MKTKHILLLGLSSLTATAAIATPIALVNSDFGGGGKPTRIVVGNVNNDSATLQIPFSEKISSTKATVTLVYENKEEQVEAEIVNDNDGTKVILTNLKPNTNYQIKQMKFDDKIINFKDSQFATKDNTLEQDVVVQPNEEQKLPKTVGKTDENKEESKKSDNQQEDKYEQGKSTKVEEPVVTPGVGAQPAVLPQQVESKEADNSAEKQKEEKPKDQSDNNGPSSNISAQNEVTQPEPEVKQETEKDQEITQPKVENSSQETSVQDSQKSNETSEPDSTSPQVNSSSEVQTQNQISSSAGQSESTPKDSESVSQHSTTTSTPSDASSAQNTGSVEATPAQTPSQATSQDSSNALQSASNPEATINQETSSHTNNLQADTSTTIKVGYWRVNQYSTRNSELTDFIAKIIGELNLSLLVLTGISDGQHNDGQQIVSQLNKNGTGLPWKQITGSSNSTEKNKRKVSFIYNSQFVHLTSDNETVKLSTTDQDDYTIPPALVKFVTKNNKSFSIVSSVLKSNSGKQGKGGRKPKKNVNSPSPTNNQAEKLEKQLSTLIGGNEKNVIFIGDSGISTKNSDTKSPLNDYKFINLEDSNQKTSKSTSKNDSTIFTKNGADFQTEHPSLFDISNKKEKIRNKPTHNPIYVDLKFN